MDWQDEGIVLGARRHGETSAVLSVLTREHGRHAGLLRGFGGKRLRGVVEPGNRLHVTWRARLAEHLGSWAVEPGPAVAALVLGDPLRLAALGSACAMVEACLPEREPHPGVFDAMALWLDLLAEDGPWAAAYVKWEVGLLGDLGFGLDLTACAGTGTTEDLAYVSPKSGRAVSRAAGAPYKGRLLPLPAFLLTAGAIGDDAEVTEGLTLTGYFLDRHILQGRGLPAGRTRLASLIAAQKEGSRGSP